MSLLYDYQMDAVKHMKNGCILCGGVGSGKSRTAVGYFFQDQGGNLENPDFDNVANSGVRDLYIITTARKRDTNEWETDLLPYALSTKPEYNFYPIEVIVDSWNNIKKYEDVENAFFIFDEQRVVGSGVWVKAFLKIAKQNRWILLSATPGDTWMDYVPVFIANGFYKNRSEFISSHVIYKRGFKFPLIDRYWNTKRLERLRDNILVQMDFKRTTVSHHKNIATEYDQELYRKVFRTSWDPYKDEPIVNAGAMCYVLRKIVNSDPTRSKELLDIYREKHRIIVFYNFDYELDILKGLDYGKNVQIAEWNGHKHQDVPSNRHWVYLVQYNAGAEGWNCTLTDTMVFYSQNYSYKVMIQSAGRIDRLNTPYRDLYYYHLKTKSQIDNAISRALKEKRTFNETKFLRKKGV